MDTKRSSYLRLYRKYVRRCANIGWVPSSKHPMHVSVGTPRSKGAVAANFVEYIIAQDD